MYVRIFKHVLAMGKSENVIQNTQHYSQLAKPTNSVKSKIHGNVSHVANCFCRCYNSKKLQNRASLVSKYCPKSHFTKYLVKFT